MWRLLPSREPYDGLELEQAEFEKLREKELIKQREDSLMQLDHKLSHRLRGVLTGQLILTTEEKSRIIASLPDRSSWPGIYDHITQIFHEMKRQSSVKEGLKYLIAFLSKFGISTDGRVD